MCLAKVYLNGRDNQAVLQDIARMRLHDGRVELETLFGEARVISGRVIEVDFSASRILLDGDSEPEDRHKGSVDVVNQ
ncbi:MAG: CooT family nickel-binding protein [Dehalococcoidales bacterium]|nr:CooT family nickel-binding protein [Dehalococcoidales bacterium]